MPCHPARARKLLNKHKARIYRMYPLTIILTDRENGEIQDTEYKVDPGSKTTGIALVGHFKKGNEILMAFNLEHRGSQIKDNLLSRRAIRQSRRNRHTRYRSPRFDNRRRKENWLPPSLQSRIQNIVQWAKKLWPISSITVESVKFDTQLLQNPEISSVEYQQGELAGYEVREYLLEKFGHQCTYCNAKNVPLEIEHIIPRAKGGSNRISNLTIACQECNQKKGTQSIQDFLKHDTVKINKILAQIKKPLKDAAIVNSTRFMLGSELKKLGKPCIFASGGQTKFNRTKQGYRKEHWIDAACVAESGAKVYIPKSIRPLNIKAVGRGSRQVCLVNKYGFPRSKAKAGKRFFCFQTGDIVKAVVTTGKKIGTYIGKVAVRATGSFNIGKVQGISYKYCKLLARSDGYDYLRKGHGFLPSLKAGVSTVNIL